MRQTECVAIPRPSLTVMQITTITIEVLLNVAKKHYIDKLLLECDSCLIQEHWLLNNRLSDLNTDYKDYVTFAVNGMTEHSLITGRPYGGCAVFYESLLNVILHLLTVKIIVFVQFCVILNHILY